MVVDVEFDFYGCQACKQVFKDSRKPTECPQCQSSEIGKTDVEQLTLRQFRKIILSNHPTDSISRRHYLYRHLRLNNTEPEIIREMIPTVEEVKQGKIKRQEQLKQKEIERQELLKQGYCPHCKAPIVLLMLDCPRCQNPYKAEVKSDVFFIN